MASTADVECQLCPKLCRIAAGQSGECRVRINLDGALKAVTYGFPSALHVDPVEKKPLFHFKPASRILSVATAGCNLHCKNCQNWRLSQGNPEEVDTYALTPAALVALAQQEACPSIAYTYSEPIVYYEYTFDASVAARERGLANVMVTAGYANAAPMRELFPHIDAANVDLKFFDDRRYREITGARLAPVLSFIVLAKEMGVWVELTNLVIPTLSDDPEMVREMCRWIVHNVGPQTPLHFSRFVPRHRLKNLPPTPPATLVSLRAIALAEGLQQVYIGNVPGNEGEHTRCPRCPERTLIIERHGYHVRRHDLKNPGHCPKCGAAIAGVWS